MDLRQDQPRGVTAPNVLPQGSRSTEPVPKRYRWLKRIGIGVVVLIVALVGLRIWWGVVADRRLRAEIDRCRAAGEPIFPADFNPEPVPAEQNAAKVYRKALDALSTLTGEQIRRVRDLYYDPCMVAANWEEVGRIIEATTEMRKLVRKARSMPKVDWGYRLPGSTVGTVTPDLSSHRQLSRVLSLAAIYECQSGNQVEAVETIQDLLVFSRHVAEWPFLTSCLTARAIEGVACRRIEDIAPRLGRSTGGGQTDRPASRSASVDQIRALRDQLIDDRPMLRAAGRAFQMERMMSLECALSSAEGRISPLVTGVPAAGPPGGGKRALGDPFSPLYILDGARTVRHLSNWIDAFAAPTWPAWQAKAGYPPHVGGGISGKAHLISRIYLSGSERAVVLHYHSLAVRHMAATRLAILLYEMDHGRRPGTLRALVPDYLPSVPLDPFGSDGRKLSYRPHADRPVLYSVNEDGIDQRGAFQLRGASARSDTTRDLVFFLNGDRPIPRD